jgi:hypothetical protein
MEVPADVIGKATDPRSIDLLRPGAAGDIRGKDLGWLDACVPVVAGLILPVSALSASYS